MVLKEKRSPRFSREHGVHILKAIVSTALVVSFAWVMASLVISCVYNEGSLFDPKIHGFFQVIARVMIAFLHAGAVLIFLPFTLWLTGIFTMNEGGFRMPKFLKMHWQGASILVLFVGLLVFACFMPELRESMMTTSTHCYQHGESALRQMGY